MDRNSSTGINNVNRRSPIEGLIFNQSICPKCGNESLDVLTKKIKGHDVKLRYECYNCGYICPIKHDGNVDINPSYDLGVYNFISNFGIHIKERIIDLYERLK